MQTANPYLKEYKKNQIQTATPEEILILLYDGAIQFLIKAKAGIESKDNEQVNNNILACQKIIREFINTLDMENGGSVAENLRLLYEYFIKTLVSANINKDMRKVNEILKHLKNLRETWQKAITIANNEKNANLLESCKTQNSQSYKNSDEDSYTSESEDDDDEEDDDGEDSYSSEYEG